MSVDNVVALYRGVKVAVYKVDKTELQLTHDDLVELVNVSRSNHSKPLLREGIDLRLSVRLCICRVHKVAVIYSYSQKNLLPLEKQAQISN